MEVYTKKISCRLQLETIEESNASGKKLNYNYNVVPGVCRLEKYGIYLAKLSWPATIIKYAEDCFSTLSTDNKVYLTFSKHRIIVCILVINGSEKN